MRGALESLGRIRVQGLALLAVAFLAGGLAGVAADRMLTGEDSGSTWAMRPGPGPGVLPPFLERLDLTPEQRARIRAILERYRPRTDSILRESLPRLRAVIDSARTEIRDVLTPEQRQLLEERIPRFRRGPPPAFRGPVDRPGPGPSRREGP